MNVVGFRNGRVVLYDPVHLWQIQAPGGDIRTEEDSGRGIAERSENVHPVFLGHASVKLKEVNVLELFLCFGILFFFVTLAVKIILAQDVLRVGRQLEPPKLGLFLRRFAAVV